MSAGGGVHMPVYLGGGGVLGLRIGVVCEDRNERRNEEGKEKVLGDAQALPWVSLDPRPDSFCFTFGVLTEQLPRLAYCCINFYYIYYNII